MSQDVDRYLYFNVGLLKGSFALDALWQDALKYHMIDQPNKLIALRLTEYYELMAKGVVASGPTTAQVAAPAAPAVPAHPTPAPSNGVIRETTPVRAQSTNGTSSMNNQAIAYQTEDEGLITTSPDVDQNADAAADYWSML